MTVKIRKFLTKIFLREFFLRLLDSISITIQNFEKLLNCWICIKLYRGIFGVAQYEFMVKISQFKTGHGIWQPKLDMKLLSSNPQKFIVQSYIKITKFHEFLNILRPIKAPYNFIIPSLIQIAILNFQTLAPQIHNH